MLQIYRVSILKTPRPERNIASDAMFTSQIDAITVQLAIDVF
jgi:hypothetical protein